MALAFQVEVVADEAVQALQIGVERRDVGPRSGAGLGQGAGDGLQIGGDPAQLLGAGVQAVFDASHFGAVVDRLLAALAVVLLEVLPGGAECLLGGGRRSGGLVERLGQEVDLGGAAGLQAVIDRPGSPRRGR